MKTKINFKAIALSLMVLAFSTSCNEEDDRVVWTGSYVQFNSATSGDAYLRTNDGLNVDGEIQVNLVAAPSSSATSVTVQIDADNTTAVAGVHYVDTSGGSISIAAGENIGAIPFEVIDDNIEAGEEWVIAYTITGSDTDLGPAVSHAHTIEVSCLLTEDKMPGDWVIDMQDSYGDGWNGAAVTVEIDGVGTNYTIADGPPPTNNSAQHTVTVPGGTTSLKFLFVSGDWDGEITFQITAPNGEEVGDYGPSPLEGEFEVNNCLL